jgi:phenylacetate-coenzyme A ligase PaaK-like adenylate-forming protein
MPFIRYQPGDLISSFIDYSQCRCQRNLPKIKKISGRSADSIKLPNGRSLNGHSFSAIIKKFAIDQWQIIESKNQIEVKILPSNQFQKSDMHKFMNDLNLLCRDSIEIKVTISKFNDFVTSKSGKNRVIIKDTSL